MRRKKIAAAMVAAALVGGIVASNVGTAQATDPFRTLVRHVLRLEKQVDALQQKVSGLQHEVYQCEALTPPLTVIDQGSGMTWGPDVFVDYSC
jgi:hypothetical protein